MTREKGILTIHSWNVNGYRSVMKKGFLEWLTQKGGDIICLQETRIDESQVDRSELEALGWKSWWVGAEKKGYSGVSILSRIPADDVHVGLGISEYDSEGRTIAIQCGKWRVISAYYPNSRHDHSRLDYKTAFCDSIQEHCLELVSQGNHVAVMGDYNIAHTEIDLANPKTNRENPGFLPQERACFDRFMEAGFRDTFRMFTQEGGHYSWWSFRKGVRERNVGWRIDYGCVDAKGAEQVQGAAIHPDAYGSDHCPVSVRLSWPG